MKHTVESSNKHTRIAATQLAVFLSPFRPVLAAGYSGSPGIP
jgi:hypothetical protein